MPYLDHFNLKEPPFRLTPDPAFVYWSPQHLKARRYLDSTVWLADGFVVVTGEIGSGKTTLIQSFLSELDDSVVYAVISQTQLNPTEFLQAVLTAFGFRPFDKGKVEMIDMLKRFMVEQYADGKHVVLIVDEAQNLGMDVLEEIRLLSGIEAQKDKILRIILAGQPQLRDKIESPELEQLMQRVRLQFHLGPLNRDELREYVEHRVEVAGCATRDLFADDVYDELYRYTAGTPRLINTLCDSALLCAFADENRQVPLKNVLEAAEGLGWKPRDAEGSSAAASEPAPVAAAQPAAEPASSPDVNAKPEVTALARIFIRINGKPVSAFGVARGRVVIGSTPENEVRIASNLISEHHAMLVTGDTGSTIMDLSENGIFAGSHRIDKHMLRHGDVIALDPHGIHELVYFNLREEQADPLVVDGAVPSIES